MPKKPSRSHPQCWIDWSTLVILDGAGALGGAESSQKTSIHFSLQELFEDFLSVDKFCGKLWFMANEQGGLGSVRIGYGSCTGQFELFRVFAETLRSEGCSGEGSLISQIKTLTL